MSGFRGTHVRVNSDGVGRRVARGLNTLKLAPERDTACTRPGPRVHTPGEREKNAYIIIRNFVNTRPAGERRRDASAGRCGWPSGVIDTPAAVSTVTRAVCPPGDSGLDGDVEYSRRAQDRHFKT